MIDGHVYTLVVSHIKHDLDNLIRYGSCSEYNDMWDLEYSHTLDFDNTFHPIYYAVEELIDNYDYATPQD